MPKTRYRTVFLDAGGVIVMPNFPRLADALARRGISVSAAALAGIEPYVKQELDHGPTIQATDDRGRGYVYFDRILELAGIPSSPATEEAIEELVSFNDREGAFDVVTPGAVDALNRLRRAACRLVVVSNPTSTSCSIRTRRASKSRTRASSKSRSNDRRRTARPRFTAATSTTSTSSARGQPDCLRCCSTPRVCTGRRIARECSRCPSSPTSCWRARSTNPRAHLC